MLTLRTVTILEKSYGPFTHLGLKKISRHLRHLCEDLDVKIISVECDTKGWVRVAFSGEDEEVVTSYLKREFGIAISTIEDLETGGNLRGRIVDSGSVGYGLYVDLGITHPKEVDALIPLHELRTQLVRSRKIPLREVTHAFCLFDNLPLEIVPTRVDREGPVIEARLSDLQLSLFNDWELMNLERLVVIGATSQQVKKCVTRSGHRRDVLRVKDLGLLESSVICKLGTHAKGLIPKLGRYLRGASMQVFIPRVTRELRVIDYPEGAGVS